MVQSHESTETGPQLMHISLETLCNFASRAEYRHMSCDYLFFNYANRLSFAGYRCALIGVPLALTFFIPHFFGCLVTSWLLSAFVFLLADIFGRLQSMHPEIATILFTSGLQVSKSHSECVETCGE
jgi:hypothetical protein